MTKKISIEGHDITFEITGTGYPVFFIHGFGEDRSVWDEFIVPFTGNYQIIRPDLPGFGESPSWEGVRIEKMAKIIHAIFEELRLDKCIMIGHSMGGYVSLSFAEQFGDRLDGLGLFHSHPFSDTEEKRAGRLKGLEFLERNGAEGFVKELAPKLFGASAREKFKTVINILIEKGIEAGPEGLIESLKAMASRPDRSRVLADLDIPVLFIIGRDDELVPWAYSLDQTPLPKIASIHIMEGVGHAGMFEAKEETQEIVRMFLEFSLSPPSP